MRRKSATVLLADMECAGGTAHTAEMALQAVPGVMRAYVNPATEAAYVEYDEEQCSEHDLEAAVESIGFHVLAPSAHAPTAGSQSVARHAMPDTTHRPRLFWWAFAGFVAIAAFFLLEEHRAHIFGYLPYLLLLACPFMHLFGHGGHGHGGHSARHEHDAHHDETASRGSGSW